MEEHLSPSRDGLHGERDPLADVRRGDGAAVFGRQVEEPDPVPQEHALVVLVLVAEIDHALDPVLAREPGRSLHGKAGADGQPRGDEVEIDHRSKMVLSPRSCHPGEGVTWGPAPPAFTARA
jgi:hypothetical protein